MDRPELDLDTATRQLAAFPPSANVTPATLALHNNFVAAVTALKRDLLRSVHYLRIIQDRRVHRALGYADITAYAGAAVGFSPEQTRAFLVLGRQLERFPETKQALAEGRLSWSKARLIVTKADPQEERTWLDAARGLATGRLRKALADAAQMPATTGFPDAEAPEGTTQNPGGQSPGQQMPLVGTSSTSEEAPHPAHARPGPVPLRTLSVQGDLPGTKRDTPVLPRRLVISYSLTPEQYARWEALTASRTAGAKEEQLLAGLEAANREKVTETRGAGPGYLLTISRCPQCQSADLVTSRGRFPVMAPLLQASQCDAVLQAADGSRRATVPPRLRRNVLARDGHRCQSPGCSHTRHLEVHHRLPVAQGGQTNQENLVTLCTACHRELHQREFDLFAAGRDPCE